MALFGTLPHLGMDSLNSYGVHPFWPFNNEWFYGDSVFIVEPLYWIAAAPMFFVLRTIWARVVLGFALLIALAATVVTYSAQPGWYLGIVMLTASFLYTSKRASARAAAWTSAVTAVGVTSMFIVAGLAAAHRAEAIDAQAFPSEQRVDHVLTPRFASPLCWDVLMVQTGGGQYIGSGGDSHELAGRYARPAVLREVSRARRHGADEPRSGTPIHGHSLVRAVLHAAGPAGEARRGGLRGPRGAAVRTGAVCDPAGRPMGPRGPALRSRKAAGFCGNRAGGQGGLPVHRALGTAPEGTSGRTFGGSGPNLGVRRGTNRFGIIPAVFSAHFPCGRAPGRSNRMLQRIRDSLQSQKWITYVVIGALILVFAAWGAYGIVDLSLGPANYAAKANGEKISVKEAQDAWQRQQVAMARQFGGTEIPAELKTRMQDQMLEAMIGESLLHSHADKLGYRISDAALHKEAQQLPAFQVEGKYSPEAARYALPERRPQRSRVRRLDAPAARAPADRTGRRGVQLPDAERDQAHPVARG